LLDEFESFFELGMLLHKVDDCFVGILDFFVCDLHVHVISSLKNLLAVIRPAIVVWWGARLLTITWSAFSVRSGSSNNWWTTSLFLSAFITENYFTACRLYASLAVACINSGAVGSYCYLIAWSFNPLSLYFIFFVTFNFHFWFIVNVASSFSFMETKLFLLNSLPFLQALLVHLLD